MLLLLPPVLCACSQFPATIALQLTRMHLGLVDLMHSYIDARAREQSSGSTMDCNCAIFVRMMVTSDVEESPELPQHSTICT